MGQDLADLLRTHQNGRVAAGAEVAAADLRRCSIGRGIGRTDLDLDLLRSSLADGEVVAPSEVLLYGLVHVEAPHGNGPRDHHAAQRQHRHLGGPPSDVHDHASHGVVDGKASPDRRG